MYLLRFIKTSFFIFFLQATVGISAQSDTITRAPSPYKNEYNPWFKFTQFKRGFESDSLTYYLDDLESRPRKSWSRQDSLNFAQISLRTEKIDLSEYYFYHLDVNFQTEEEYWWEEIMLKILKKDFEGGIENIHRSKPGILQYSKIYFLDKILQAYMAEEKDNKWHKEHTVLHWEVDSSLFNEDKNSEHFKNTIIRPLENLDFVLKQLIHYVHEDDPIIAEACFEMGVILENHVSHTQAYIAYSLGRHYNKRDKEILSNIKNVKAKLSEKKYKIPIFRRYFPRIEYWRFEYEVLKEKIILNRQDTLNKLSPTLMLPTKGNPIPFPPELIIIAGLLVLFILVLIFVRTKKKKKS